MYKKIAPVIILLFSISLSAISQTTDAGLNGKTKNSANSAGFSEKDKGSKSINHHVVIQLSSSDTLVWKGMMNNIKHIKEIWGDSVQIEVVAHGPGIGILVAASTTEQKNIAGFKKMGVVFAACENTLRQKNIPREAIIPEAVFVPSGVGEIIMKQEQGWSYLKAGF